MSIAAWKRIPVGTPVTLEVHTPNGVDTLTGEILEVHRGTFTVKGEMVSRRGNSYQNFTMAFYWPKSAAAVRSDTPARLEWQNPRSSGRDVLIRHDLEG
jgi:hypothetical protein